MMRAIKALAAAMMLGLAAMPAGAQDDPAEGPASPIPERRIDLMPDTDLPGGDLGPVFDTTLQACIQTCLGQDECRALTYNASSRACFPKGDGAGAPVPFASALSGRVIRTPPELAARAQARMADAGFLSQSDVDEARNRAGAIAAFYPPTEESEPAVAAPRAESQGDRETAIHMTGILTAQRDRAGDWTNLARLVLAGIQGSDGAAARSAGFLAINGYLRAEDDATAARALALLADSHERTGRGQDGLAALRLANRLSPDDQGIGKALETAQERHGMRVTDSQLDTDATTPRFCASMSRALDTGVDYADFLRLPSRDMTVTAEGRLLCIGGLAFGQELELTLRAGLPAADGETLARDVTLRSYIRDRDPVVRFAGRAYVLPSGGDQGLTVTTVNADQLDLTLLRLSDRNLLRVMAEGMFATPLDSWQARYFNDGMATGIWSGTADISRPAGQDGRNQELTTRLPVTQAGPLDPGIYILQASVAGQDAREQGVAAQWFVISDFGISSFAGNDGLGVVVRSLATTQAVAGVEVALVSRANEVLARAETDDQGVARFAPGLSMGTGASAPALITVTRWQGEGAGRQPQDMAFLSLTDPEFDLSDRGVEGQPPAPPIDIFATTDRGAYRVGETVNATILARDATVQALDELPLTALMIRPDGVEQARMAARYAGAGGYTVEWALPANAPRGTWRMDIRAEADGPTLASARVLVEDFLPERIDFTPLLQIEGPNGDVQDDDGQDDASPAAAGQPARITLDARWLFGAPAADLPVEAAIWTAPRRTLDGFAGYRFGPHDAAAQPFARSLGGGRTDEQGRFATAITLPQADETDQRPFDARVVVNVREGAGRPVERSVSRLVMPDRPVIGIRPLAEDDTVPEGSDALFDLIAPGPDLQPVALDANWVLNRIDTRYEWYSIHGSWNWETITERRRLDGGQIRLGDTPARLAARVDWGSYELVVEGPDGQASSVRFYAGWGVAQSGTDTPDRLKVALDKPAYRSGDTARLSVEALAEGTGIVSVLSGHVVSQQIVPLSQGDNAIELPVTDEWGAGVYVTVSALRPLDGIQPGDRLPARAIGLVHAAVDPGPRALQASLEVPAEIRPRQQVPVTLRVEGAQPGQTVHATIAAVDQGILNLTGFAPPDPSQHYFGQRRLGVGLRDLYGRLILPSGAPDGALRQGGDAQSVSPEAPPPTERLMSWFSGPLTLGPDGTAQIDLQVPDFNGEIRVMAVTWTEDAIGQADATILSRDPVVMTVTAPAILAPGDHAEIGLRLTHAAGPGGEVALALAQTGGQGAVDAALPQDSLTLDQGAQAQLSLPVTAGQQQGLVEMRLTLTTPGGEDLTKDIALLVALNEPPIQRQDRLTIAPGSSLALPASLTRGMAPGAQLSMAVGNYGRLDVAGALARLQRYPYGCTEQMTSVALPLLYLPRLSMIEGVDQNNPNPSSVDEAIARILTRQSASGGFGLWYASSGDMWLDAYVTDFLSRARVMGHEVPDTAFRRAIDNLRNQVNYATDPRAASDQENAALAYAVAVLARERAAAIGDLRYYADTAADAFKTPMSAANLGAALAAYGDQARADRMFGQADESLQGDAPEPRRWRSDYGTRLRDMTALLALAAESQTQAIDLQRLTTDIAERTARQQENGTYRSTQELVWSVLAAESLSRTPGGVTVDGQAPESPVVSLSEDAALANPGPAPVEVTITATGQPLQAPAPGGNGYAITREYYALDGQPIDPAQVELGTRMVAVLTVRPASSEGGRLVVTDPLPAGFEIDNPNLLQAGDIASIDWLESVDRTEMAEFRADRFAAALVWNSRDAFRLAYILRAVTPGTFRHPAASVEDMYRPEFRAWTGGGTVHIAR